MKEYGGVLARNRNGEELKEVYYIGLIDILTAYDLKKRSELAIKTILHPQQDASSISAQPPAAYRGENIFFRVVGNEWFREVYKVCTNNCCG